MSPDFETLRPQLTHLAYGMLGSFASAEDIVQEAWIRLQRAQNVQNPGGWLRTVVTRLALDELKSARVQRETYIGPWLPELVATDADDPVVFAEALSMATLSVLQQLSASERAAFLLREMFELEYSELSELLHRSEPATRQLVARARRRLAAERPRFEPAREAHLALLGALGVASQTGDLDGLKSLLADEIQFVSDGGGKATAATRPVHGVESVARLLIGLARNLEPTSIQLRNFNGLPGMLVLEQGRVVSATVFCIHQERITAIFALRNPDKLNSLQRTNL